MWRLGDFNQALRRPGNLFLQGVFYSRLHFGNDFDGVFADRSYQH